MSNGAQEWLGYDATEFTNGNRAITDLMESNDRETWHSELITSTRDEAHFKVRLHLTDGGQRWFPYARKQ